MFFYLSNSSKCVLIGLISLPSLSFISYGFSMKPQFVTLIALTTTFLGLINGAKNAHADGSQNIYQMSHDKSILSGKVKADTKIDSQKLPIVGDKDWRSGRFNGPWSTLVSIKDDFDGDYIAVMDRNYSSNSTGNIEIGIVTNWSAKKVRMYLYQSFQSCPICSKAIYEMPPTNKLSVKAGDKIFNLTSEDGVFDISSEMALALRNATPGNVKLKTDILMLGKPDVSDIGPQTIEMWKTIYQDAEKSPSVKKSKT